MTNPIGFALRRRPVLHLLLLAALCAPVWVVGPSDRPSGGEQPVSASASHEVAADCGPSRSALVLLPRPLPRGPAARGLEGVEQLVQSCEVLRQHRGPLYEVAARDFDSTRVRAVEISRIGFSRADAFASTGTESGQTAALPPPLFA
jgi:hypothetical protein